MAARIRTGYLRAIVLVIAMFAALLPARPSFGATPITFTPVADTYVRADRPTANFGTATKLLVDNSPVIQTLMRFDLSGIGTANVVSAKLRLRAVTSAKVGGVFYRALDDIWGETSVTWNTAPAAADTPVATLGAVTKNTWYEVDVTSLVTKDGPVSLRITSTSANGTAYTSREGYVSYRPQLVVTTTPAVDTTAPTVSITSPTDGATVNGTITVGVAASDDTGVSSVELSVDGTSVGTDTTAPYSFSWNSTGVADGTHSLVATAQDAVPNVGTSATVTVTVANADVSAPSAPTNLSATATAPTHVDLLWTASTDDVGVDHYAVLREGTQVGTSTTTTYADATAPPGTMSTYVVVAYDAVGHASNPSEPASATTPTAPSSFTFAAAGDHAKSTKTAASLASLDASDASFYMALGDLDYDATSPDSAWCDYVKSHLPTKGPDFPFELVGGNHEQQGATDGYILDYTPCLPDRLNAVPEPGSVYGADSYFDYPPGNPLMRVISIVPNLTIDNTTYSFAPGSTHRDWLINTIRSARAAGIPWVTVALHYHCLTTGTRTSCDMGSSLWNLLLSEHVDLILNGHEHTYQRSKQLALDPVSCPSMTPQTYVAACIGDDGTDGVYPKGAGSVNVIAGTFGQGPTPVSENDVEARYFARIDDTTNGYMTYSVTKDRIDARFVNTTGGFTDVFSIVAGATSSADVTPPTRPEGLTGTLSGATQVDLSWTASTDASGVDRYVVYRDGVAIGNTSATTFSDLNAIPGATHSYTVRAYDPAGNFSGDAVPVLVSIPGSQTVRTFTPSGDATLQQQYPNLNNGATITLVANGSPVKDFLIRFEVSGVGTGHVTSARLRLYCADSSDLGGGFYPVSGSWNESTVTWNTAPQIGSAQAAGSLGRVVAGTWYEVDVTSAVVGDGTVAFRVPTASTNGAAYASREGSSATIPQLVVTIAS